MFFGAGAIFLFLVLILNIFIWRSKKATKPFEKFLEDGRRANLARKKDIPEELYVYVDTQALPFEEYDNGLPNYQSLTRAKESALKKAERPMLKLPYGMQNNDIKIAFGAANFENVVSKEENYNQCIRALLLWAGELIKVKRFKQAQDVLNETVRLKSDLSQSYTMLFDICKETGDADQQKQLLELTGGDNFMEHNNAVRNKIRGYIKNGGNK